MGNSVNLSKLIISTSQENLYLYDHEPQHNIQTQPVIFPFYLTKSNSENMVQYNVNYNLNVELLGSPMLYKCSLFGLSNIVFENMGARSDQKIWRQIQPCKNVKMEVGDEIKIQNLIFRLKYLITEDEVENSKRHQYENYLLSKKWKQNLQYTQRTNKCRICFQSYQTEANHLINLCKCGGSVQYTHFQCLKNWIRSKVKTIEQPNCTIYQFSPLTCEICKRELPTHFYQKDRLYSLIEQENISPPYAIFQTKINAVLPQNRKIELYRVRLNEGLKVTAGRSGDSDIPLKCPTVSRNHFLLFYTHKQLFIKDLKSKYGTYLFSKNAHFSFNLQYGLTLMIKRSRIKISKQKEPFLSLNCCKGLQDAQVRIIDDTDDKFTVQTSRDLLDFLQL